MNKSNRRLKALMVKEIWQIIRDPSALLISFVLPLVLTFLYAYGVSLDLNHLRIALVMEDTSPDAITLSHSFTDSRYFEVKIVRNEQEVLENLEEGAIRGIVVIPSYFTQFRYRNKLAPIYAIADGSEPNTAAFFQNYVQGAFHNWLLQDAISSRKPQGENINIESRFWYNEELESRNFLLPGSLAIIMTLIGILLTALVIAREWERGTMEALISTPIKIREFMIGKFVPYFFLGIFSMAICFCVNVFLLSVPFRGSILLLGLVVSVFLFSALAIGLMISTLAKNQLLAFQVSVVTGFLPAYILSGFLFEISSMPLIIQFFTYLMPARYFVSSLQTLFLVGNVWGLIIWNLIPMLLMGVIFMSIAIYKTNKSLENA